MCRNGAVADTMRSGGGESNGARAQLVLEPGSATNITGADIRKNIEKAARETAERSPASYP